MRRCFAILVFLLCSPVLVCSPAFAQHDHERHHAVYKDWVNGQDKGCCNNQDCGELDDDQVRQTSTGIFVHIGTQWCPVRPWHYLKRGNAPDWSSAHACVLSTYPGDARSPCERFICFQPKPGF
jgi:hypothetical protein